jgi:hypothetical protein
MFAHKTLLLVRLRWEKLYRAFEEAMQTNKTGSLSNMGEDPVKKRFRSSCKGFLRYPHSHECRDQALSSVTRGWIPRAKAQVLRQRLRGNI